MSKKQIDPPKKRVTLRDALLRVSTLEARHDQILKAINDGRAAAVSDRETVRVRVETVIRIARRLERTAMYSINRWEAILGVTLVNFLLLIFSLVMSTGIFRD